MVLGTVKGRHGGSSVLRTLHHVHKGNSLSDVASLVLGATLIYRFLKLNREKKLK